MRTRRNRKRRRLGSLCVCAVLAMLILPVLGHSSMQLKSWNFERFDAEIHINKDSSLTVRETQVANFTGHFSFLTRSLSTKKAGFSGGRTYGKVRYSDIKVYYLDGKPYEKSLWGVKSVSGGKEIKVNFEAADTRKGWIFEYRIKGVIIFGTDNDRLYYNTVSVDRGVPIKQSKVTVILPGGTDMNQVKSIHYPISGAPPEAVKTGREGTSIWWTATDIAPYTTLTIDVAFPKGIVQVPVQFRMSFGYAMIAVSALLALITLLIMLVLWWRKGRDIGRPELDIVQYEPPEGLKPAMVGMLVNEAPKVTDISATIVDCAIRGKLTIFEEEKEGLLGGKKYGFRATDADISDLDEYEKGVINALFESGKDEVTQDDLHDKFYVHVKGIEDSISEKVLKKGLFAGDPTKVRHKYFLIALLVLVVPSVAIALLNVWVFDMGWILALIPGFVAAGLVLMVVGNFMPRRSPSGSAAYSQVMGFKEYMETAEHDEMEFMTPENFQNNLPYAMVLGVTEKWAKKFEGIYTTPPVWFQGSYTGTFGTVYLASSLSHMQTGLSTTMTSSPSSSSGGGGFGGGFSGGGFGGGGSGAG